MSAVAAIAAIAGGRRCDRLLESCRLEVGGFDAFGVEAIGDAFRRDPLALSAAATVEDDAHFASVVDGQAIFADLYDGHVGRLWRVGRSAPHAAEPFVAVAFDPDLRQARGDVAFDHVDHRGLAVDAATRVRGCGLDILARDPAAWRSRAFCIRAFGSAGRGAALFALYRMTSARVRTSGFGYAVAIWEGDDSAYALDTVPLPGDARVRIAA